MVVFDQNQLIKGKVKRGYRTIGPCSADRPLGHVARRTRRGTANPPGSHPSVRELEALLGDRVSRRRPVQADRRRPEHGVHGDVVAHKLNHVCDAQGRVPSWNISSGDRGYGEMVRNCPSASGP